MKEPRRPRKPEVGLDEIVGHKRTEVATRRLAIPLSEIERRARALPPPRPFEAVLRRGGVERIRVIAEVKRASPSRGPIRLDADAAEIAGAYARAGASAISVLTETRWFLGRDSDIEAVRRAVSLPVLRKDFVVDAYQVFEARALGADAVLLLATLHRDRAALRSLVDAASSLDMAALVEAHGEDDLALAIAAGARIVGINNRDLRSFDVDPGRALRLLDRVPRGLVRVAESGISSPEAVRALATAGADAILVGEALMASPDPGAELRRLLT